MAAEDWFPVLNSTSESIPAFGIMRVTGVGDNGATVLAPNATSEYDVSMLLVNGDAAIPAGTNGHGHRTFPCVMAYDTGATPAVGELWGPKSGQWKLYKASASSTLGLGYVILGAASGGFVNVTVRPAPGHLKGKLDGTLSYQGSATVSVWTKVSGTETDTGINVTAYDWLLSSGQTVASGKQVFLALEGGVFYVIAAQCA